MGLSKATNLELRFSEKYVTERTHKDNFNISTYFANANVPCKYSVPAAFNWVIFCCTVAKSEHTAVDKLCGKSFSDCTKKSVPRRKRKKDSTIIHSHRVWILLRRHDGSRSVWPDRVIFWTLGNFSKPVAKISLPKSPTFLTNSCKVSKFLFFLVKSFLGNFYRHLATFHWSHCSRCTAVEATSSFHSYANTARPLNTLNAAKELQLVAQQYFNRHCYDENYSYFWTLALSQLKQNDTLLPECPRLPYSDFLGSISLSLVLDLVTYWYGQRLTYVGGLHAVGWGEGPWALVIPL